MATPVALVATAAVMAALILMLHAPVFTQGALITPAGMHYAQWPWKAQASQVMTQEPLLQENHTLSDLLFQVYPWQRYITRSLQSGEVPLWNPYSYTGVPFLANAQSAVFYPLHWPAFIYPTMRVFTMALILKILLAGLFMTVFLRGIGCSTVPCVVGAVSFALCGFMTSWLGYAHTNAAIFLPLLMHAARLIAVSPGSGPFLIMAFAMAAQFLGGHPETSLHMAAAASLCFVWHLPASRRPRLAFILFISGAVAGLLMAAVQLLPFLQYLSESAALEQRRTLTGMDPSLPIQALITMLLPAHFGRPWDFSYHGPAAWQAVAAYSGAGVLLLAIVSLAWWREVRLYLCLLLGSMTIVYGPDWVRAGIRWIPVVGISSNNRLILIVGFSLAVLAAISLQRILTIPEASRSRRSLMLILGLGALALSVAAVHFGGDEPAELRLALAMIIGTALLTTLAITRPARARLYLAGLIAVTMTDMGLSAFRFNPHADPDLLFPPTKLTDFLRADSVSDPVRGGRMLTIGWMMRPETQLVYGLASIEGYDAMEFARYRHLLDRAGVAAIHETGDVPEAARPLLNLTGARYFVTPPGGVVSGEQMRLAYDGEDGRVFVNEQARPRVYFAAGWSALPVKEQLDALAGGQSGSAGKVVLDEGAILDMPVQGEQTGPSPGITLARNAPGSLVIKVAGNEQPGVLVVTDAWHSGWRATVNGEQAQILRANHCFMAVPIPAGHAEVTLSYRPGAFTLGAWISIFSLLGAVAIGLARLGRAEER